MDRRQIFQHQEDGAKNLDREGMHIGLKDDYSIPFIALVEIQASGTMIRMLVSKLKK